MNAELLRHLCVVWSGRSDVVDKCRRPGELMVTYNPSFTSSNNASPSSLPSTAAGAGAAGIAGLVTSPSLASSSRSTSNSSFSPHGSTCRSHTVTSQQSRDVTQPPPPLHRPHSVTGWCLFLFHQSVHIISVPKPIFGLFDFLICINKMTARLLGLGTFLVEAFEDITEDSEMLDISY